MRVVGKRTSRPSIDMFGVVCVTLCIVMRYAARIAGSRFGQSVVLCGLHVSSGRRNGDGTEKCGFC